MRRPAPALPPALVVAALLAWCAALLGVRVARTESVTFVFLSWNLALAAVPWAAGAGLRAAERARWPLWALLPVFAVWLLFLPNAPYVLTDLLHLRPRPPVPVWYDLALLLSCAGTALALGLLSLLDIHDAVARRIGRAAGWIVAVGSLFASGFGIYLGRFLRWNSWELATRPTALLADVADRFAHPAAHPRTWGVTVLFGVALTLGYALVRALREAGAVRLEARPASGPAVSNR